MSINPFKIEFFKTPCCAREAFCARAAELRRLENEKEGGALEGAKATTEEKMRTRRQKGRTTER